MSSGNMTTINPDHLYALVDMGSNGIRLSITNLTPPTTRIVPTIYQNRLGISLYDEQYKDGKRIPIPSTIISTIVAALQRFKQIALDFGVPNNPSNVRILATEATRTALNAQEYISTLETALSNRDGSKTWRVSLLPKEEEGRIGALGVISSVNNSAGIQGLMMDLGGGSTQLTWLSSSPGKPLQTCPTGSISFPYGAAALTRLLAEADASKNPSSARASLREQITQQYRDAYTSLSLPDYLTKLAENQGLTLFLSGGGFRGWGYLLLSSHKIRPYPIPIINGFTSPTRDFKDTGLVQTLALQCLNDELPHAAQGVFRVSKRRAAQVPAVSFLIDSLMDAIPVIKEVRFCQGGVREGWLFDSLPPEIKDQSPLVAATAPFAVDDSSVTHFAELLYASLPQDDTEMDRAVPTRIRDKGLLRALANTMFIQQGHSKESASVNALHLPITGLLANAHGLGHSERAFLAMMLVERWGGKDEIPAPHDELLAKIEMCASSQQEVWWARYIGIVARIVGEVYPAGRTSRTTTTKQTMSSMETLNEENGSKRIELTAKWCDGMGKKGNLQGVKVKLCVLASSPPAAKCEGENEDKNEGSLVARELLCELAEEMEKIGKKKNRVGGREYGFGVPVKVNVHQISAR